MSFFKKIFGIWESDKDKKDTESFQFEISPEPAEEKSTSRTTKQRLKELSRIGITDQTCPYCKTELIKFPGRKTKCKACSSFMYIRTRPTDKKKVIIKEDEIEFYEEVKAIEQGWHEEYLELKKKKDSIRKELLDSGKKNISDLDIQIKIDEEKINNDILNKNWAFLSSSFFIQGNNYEGRQPKKALDMFLMAYYVALSGGSSAGLPFEPEDTANCPAKGVATHLIKENSFTFEGTTKYVRSLTEHFHKNYGFPVTPQDFLARIKREMF